MADLWWIFLKVQKNERKNTILIVFFSKIGDTIKK
jgi:hypothetical protein